MATEIRSAAVGALAQHRVFRVTYADLITASTSETEAIVTLPVGAELDHAWFDLVEAFEGPAASSITGQLGTSADTDAFVTATELLSGPPATGRKMARGVWRSGSGAALIATFTATGDNFGDGTDTDQTAGILDIHVVYREF